MAQSCWINQFNFPAEDSDAVWPTRATAGRSSPSSPSPKPFLAACGVRKVGSCDVAVFVDESAQAFASFHV
jgi:hypothetical protein